MTSRVLRYSGFGITTSNSVNELEESVEKTTGFVKKILTILAKVIFAKKGIFVYIVIKS